MYIGILKVKIHLAYNQSLKGKRSVLKSLMGRLHSKIPNLAISEIDYHDLWQMGSIAIINVSNDAQQAQKILAKVLDFIKEWQSDYVLLDHQLEVMNYYQR